MNVGGAEILLVLVVALIVLGPNRLPEAARSVGKALGEFRRMSAGFQAEVRDAFSDTAPASGEPPSRLPAGGPDGSAAAGTAEEAGTGGTGRDRAAE